MRSLGSRRTTCGPLIHAAQHEGLVAVASNQQVEAEGTKDEVGKPHGDPGLQLADASGLFAIGQQYVIDHDDRNGHGKPRGATAPTSAIGQRQGDNCW